MIRLTILAPRTRVKGAKLFFEIATSASVSKENLNSVNGTLKPSEIPASVVVPKSVLLEPKIPDSRIPDLLQPLKIEEFNNTASEKPVEVAPPPGNLKVAKIPLFINFNKEKQ